MSNRTLCFVFAWLLLIAAPSQALEIKETRWGFNGNVAPGRFNILSILVSEPSPKAFDGELALIEKGGAGHAVGAPIAQTIYVTPGTQRWVQFVPFVAHEAGWTLRWGSGEKQRADVTAPKFDPPASVVFLDPSSPFGASARMRGFSEDLFPTSVAATDGLDQAVMDHPPRWDAPRREAFLDWLHRGGVVHLLRGPSGLPVFEGDLAVLNSTEPQHSVGAGLVVQHDALRVDFGDDQLKAAGFAPRVKMEAEMTHQYLWEFDQSILTNLASLTKPEVSWWLLYLLTIAYLVIIGPVHYKWSRTVDYRLAIGGFLGTVVVFALAFIIAGRRGAGETQTAHTLAVARALPGQRWDTMQWTSAFATSGSYYRLSHAAAANYYSATNSSEGVNGKIVGGKDGYFEVDIPLYSSRPFLHRAVMPGPDLSAEVAEWTTNRLEIRPGPGFPPEIQKVFVQRVDGFLTLEKKGNNWVWNGSDKADSKTFFDSMHNAMSLNMGRQQFFPAEAYRALTANLLGSVEGVQHQSTARTLASNRIRLFVYAKGPESFAMKGKGFKGEKSHVLYVQEILRQGGSGSPASLEPANPAK